MAESYPARTVTIVVPWPAGNAPDGIARIAATKLGNRLGQSFVVENRPGAGSALGVAAVAKAAPDGHTLLVATAAVAINATLRKSAGYDPEKDLVPLAMVGYVPFVLVANPSLPVHSVSDLVALAKQKPGELSFGSGGPGHPGHFYAELLKRRAGIQTVLVPYQGSPPALNDLVGGHIDLLFSDIQPALPLVAAGKLRALAVSSSTRVTVAPEIPPMSEAIPGFEGVAWIMFMAPARTPPQVVGRLRAELVPIMAESEVQAWIVQGGLIPPRFQAPDELQRFLGSEIAHWRDVLSKLGLSGSQ